MGLLAKKNFQFARRMFTNYAALELVRKGLVELPKKAASGRVAGTFGPCLPGGGGKD